MTSIQDKEDIVDYVRLVYCDKAVQNLINQNCVFRHYPIVFGIFNNFVKEIIENNYDINRIEFTEEKVDTYKAVLWATYGDDDEDDDEDPYYYADTIYFEKYPEYKKYPEDL